MVVLQHRQRSCARLGLRFHKSPDDPRCVAPIARSLYGQEDFLHTFVVQQVEVTHALAEFWIAQASVFVWRWFQGLGVEEQAFGEDGQFAGVGATESSFATNQIAEVPQHGLRPVVTDLLLTDEDLNLTGPIADVGKDQFTGMTQQDDAPSDPDFGTNFFASP